MIEQIMFALLGFFLASLIALSIIPFVHARAVRLTARRIEAAAPLSIAEIQADKDQLRAEFAMATRRLETTVEQLRSKTTSQLAEIGKRAEAMNRLRTELAEKSAALADAESREKALQEHLHATRQDLEARSNALGDAERKLAEREAEIAKTGISLEERSITGDSQRIEIVALNTQCASLRDRVSDLEAQAKQLEARLARERSETDRLNQELTEERSKAHHLSLRLMQAERATGSNHESERAENALLRERIDEVSAEVARLTAALEGADSPIHAMLAADAADQQRRGTQNGKDPSAGTTLADRIRALQDKAKQAQHA
jgi:chromosome segregation ATPase